MKFEITQGISDKQGGLSEVGIIQLTIEGLSMHKRQWSNPMGHLLGLQAWNFGEQALSILNAAILSQETSMHSSLILVTIFHVRVGVSVKKESY